MTRRVLYLLRHAHAESVPRAGLHDADRALSAQGVTQAQAVGEYLRGQQPRIELAIPSPAVRTRETLEQLRLDADVAPDPSLYNAGGSTVVNALTGVGDDVACVLVVGHAPGIPAAVHTLADRSQSDPDALDLVDTFYPTATLSRLEFEGDWADLADGREEFAALTAAWRPER